MNRHTALARTLMASAAIACAVALGGCQTDGAFPTMSARAMRPLSPEMLARLQKKNMPVDSPILIRLFKEEAELEVWKADTTGQFALLKTYPICRWSGELGPKIKEGDRQAPEGFYTITPGQMNPNSNYYLAFNLGFPNAYDKANDRTGAFLMVHGDCSSSGCYAMTDEQMGEIYALGREALLGGQKSFQVQAYPFRMTPLNLARHRNSPYMAFWRMLKEGNDHFEVTRQEPKVDVCEKHYVFDAVAPGGGAAPLNFNPKGKCPAYEVPQEIASAVAAKRGQDDQQFAELVSRGTATVAVRTGNDGGMNPIFAAKLTPAEEYDADGREVRVAGTMPGAGPAMPATIINPPRNLALDAPTGAVGDSPAPTPVASANAASPRRGDGGNVFSSVGSTVSGWFGLRGSKPAAAPTRTASVNARQPKAVPPKPVLASAHSVPAHLSAKRQPPHHRPQPPAHQPQQDAHAQKSPPTVAASATALAPTAGPPASTAPSLIAGAQPVVQSGSFESRWDALR